MFPRGDAITLLLPRLCRLMKWNTGPRAWTWARGGHPSLSPQLYPAREGHSSQTPSCTPQDSWRNRGAQGGELGLILTPEQAASVSGALLAVSIPRRRAGFRKLAGLHPCEKQHLLCFLAP